jgi:hypothetical protein
MEWEECRAISRSAVCAVASVASFWLPMETAGRELVDTILCANSTAPPTARGVTGAIDVGGASKPHSFHHLEEEEL